jgi:hypothetical protein
MWFLRMFGLVGLWIVTIGWTIDLVKTGLELLKFTSPPFTTLWVLGLVVMLFAWSSLILYAIYNKNRPIDTLWLWGIGPLLGVNLATDLWAGCYIMTMLVLINIHLIVAKFKKFRIESAGVVFMIFILIPMILPHYSEARITKEDMEIVENDTATDNLFRMIQARKFKPDVMFYVKGDRIFVHSDIHKGTELFEHSDITSVIMRNEDKRILFLIDGKTRLNTEILISQNLGVKIFVVNLEPPPN